VGVVGEVLEDVVELFGVNALGRKTADVGLELFDGLDIEVNVLGIKVIEPGVEGHEVDGGLKVQVTASGVKHSLYV
jgi:hypothetical protein